MNSKYLVLPILVFCLVLNSLVAAQNRDSDIVIEKKDVSFENNQLSITTQLVVTNHRHAKGELLILTPYLRGTNDSIDLPSMIVTDTKGAVILKRKRKFADKDGYLPEAVIHVIDPKIEDQQIEYKVTVPVKEWMEQSQLMIRGHVSACAGCRNEWIAKELTTINKAMPDQVIEKAYQLTYPVPHPEPVKSRSDKHTANFSFITNQFHLLPDYKNNAIEFQRVDSVIKEIQSNKNFIISSLEITGYASPEASFTHNQQLASNRAKAFADYLAKQAGFSTKQLIVRTGGEDWKGLRQAVVQSDLKDRSTILSIIDSIDVPDKRELLLEKISDGTTYRQLLNEYFPPLRRTEYVISYVVKGFSVDEAKEIFKENPGLLSLNELYLVATTYSPGSKNFNEVMELAHHLYPESEIALANAATAAIESGDLNKAIEKMSTLVDNPLIWNNLGVVYAKLGEHDKAKRFFEKAMETGCETAGINYELLNQKE